MTGQIIHLSLHITLPALLALAAFRDNWKKAWLIMLLAMLVDTDHLLADPIYDPNRCSIGFHPLHSYPAIAAYLAMGVFSQTRIIAAGLIVHMCIDGASCIWTVLR